MIEYQPLKDGVLRIYCQRCNRPTIKRGPGKQKYCLTCSEESSRERARKRSLAWTKRNPLSPEKLAIQYVNNRKRMLKRHELGRTASLINRFNLDEIRSKWSSFPRVFVYSLPWTRALSKNHVFGISRFGGHIFLRQQTREIQNQIIGAFKASVVRFAQNRLMLNLYVEKPDHRCDAINIIDRVADAVKQGIGVDDRWYHIGEIDWRIVKHEPQIHIVIAQLDVSDAIVCSYCGMVKLLDQFNANRCTKSGRNRECRDCRSALGRRDS